MDWIRIAYRGVQRRGSAGVDRDRAVRGVDDRSCTNTCYGVIESRSWRPPVWVPTALATSLARCATRNNTAAMRTRRLYGSRSIGESDPGITVGALQRDTRLVTLPLPRSPSRVASRAFGHRGCGCVQRRGRIGRGTARTLPFAVAAGAVPSATSIITYSGPTRNLYAAPPTPGRPAAGLILISSRSSPNEPLFDDFVKRAHRSDDSSYELDDPLHCDAMLCVERGLHRQKLRFR